MVARLTRVIPDNLSRLIWVIKQVSSSSMQRAPTCFGFSDFQPQKAEMTTISVTRAAGTVGMHTHKTRINMPISARHARRALGVELFGNFCKVFSSRLVCLRLDADLILLFRRRVNSLTVPDVGPLASLQT
jgi:hypothetical protein